VLIRPFVAADAADLSKIWTGEKSELWHQQSYPLYGHPAATTLVAEVDGHLIGVIAGLTSPVHPHGAAGAIDIARAHRRRGYGTGLVRALQRSKPDLFPLRLKVESPDVEAFVRTLGGYVYQQCRGDAVDLAHPEITRWASRQRESIDVTLCSASRIDPSVLLDAYVDMYTWLHEAWNPAGSPTVLRERLAVELDDVSGDLSMVAMIDARIVAISLAFPSGERDLEIVAETTRSDQPNGLDVLGILLARQIQLGAVSGYGRLIFDGHISDPHLGPLLDVIPAMKDRTPLLLMAIPDTRIGREREK
jgi:GNAT superfamily N-acetyltransferase